MAEDPEANLKRLEEEKRALEEKNKNLAKVLELTARQKKTAGQDAQPPKTADDKEAGSDVQKALEELRVGMKTVKKSLKESIQGPAEKHEQMKKMVSDIEAKMKDVDKISSFEAKLADIEKKVSDQIHKSPSSLSNLFGGFGTGKVDAGTPKNAPRNIGELMKNIDEIKDGVDTRMLNMERRVDAIRHKIGNKNLERLEELLSSKQDISDNLVPQRVREEVEKILSTFSFEVEDMAEAAKTLADNVEKSNESFDESLAVVKGIQKRLDGVERIVNEVQAGYRQTSQTLGKLVGKVESMVVSGKDVEEVIKESDMLSEKVDDVEKSLKTIENDYHIKNTLRSELSRLALPKKKVKSRRTSSKKKAQGKKPAKRAGKESARKKTKTTKRKSRPSKIKGSLEAIDRKRMERINSTLRRVEMAYENGLIPKGRYERIAEKLKRLKKPG